jgi:hypothetical protein
MTDGISRLLDRAALQDLMTRYAQGVDRRDWAAVRDTFHADATDDHGDYQGGVDGFIEWVSTRHAQIDQSMHFLGNCLIEFAGDDRALVETYYVARQRSPGAIVMGGGATSGEVDVEVLGRYIDIAERRDGVWRTARRTVAFETMRTWPVNGPTLPASWALARRDDKDPLYAARRELGLG